MQLDVTFRGIDPSPHLEGFVRTWSRRLARVHPRIERCDVRIEVPHRHRRQGRRFHVAVVVAIPGRDIVVTGEAGANEDPYVAVRDACRAARRQLAAAAA
jgi:ribosome-associated translation inhibitor RaiA